MVVQKNTVLAELEGKKVRLTYCLLVQPVHADGAWRDGLTEYGVRAGLEWPDRPPEEDEVPGVTCDKGRMLTLLERMAEGRVTPVRLRDIVDDFLACW